MIANYRRITFGSVLIGLIIIAVTGAVGLTEKTAKVEAEAKIQAVDLLQSINKADETKNEGINGQLLRGDSDVKNNTPYKIKHPSNKMEGLTLVDTTLDIHNYKNAPVHIVELDYKGNNNEVLYIQQVDSSDTNPAAAEAIERVTLSNGSQAAIYDPMNGKGFIHIIFSNEGKSYDVEGINLGKDRLIKIADSLN